MPEPEHMRAGGTPRVSVSVGRYFFFFSLIKFRTNQCECINLGIYRRLFVYPRWTGYFPFRNAGDERRYSKSSWRRDEKDNGYYDPKPVFRIGHWAFGHLPCSVFLGYYRNGGEFCKRTAPYFDGIYRSYHGGKPWYHTYRLDYCYNWKV